MDAITKSPTEKFPVYFNFSTDLIAGETIYTYTLACWNAATGVTSKTAIVDSDTNLTPDIRAILKAGTEDDEHHLQCVVLTSNGNTYQRDLCPVHKVALWMTPSRSNRTMLSCSM